MRSTANAPRNRTIASPANASLNAITNASFEPELCTFSLPGGGMPVTVAAMWTHLTPASKVFLQLMTEKAKQLPAV